MCTPPREKINAFTMGMIAHTKPRPPKSAGTNTVATIASMKELLKSSGKSNYRKQHKAFPGEDDGALHRDGILDAVSKKRGFVPVST